MQLKTERRTTYRRNDVLEALLMQLNDSLGTIAPPVAHEPLRPLFILGAPRSGTTLCLQWLAISGAFSYPSNFIARFWCAPFIGALIQQMITDPALDFRGEFSDIVPASVGRQSDLGKTVGMLSSNEFWYFWRKFFPSDGDIGVDLSQATQSEFRLFGDHLSAFSSVRNRPAAIKAMIVNHQVERLAEALPEALFLVLDRDPLDNAWSLLRARQRIYGDTATWYSFGTPDKEALQRLSPHEQVAGQVLRIRADLQAALSQIDPKRYLVLEYEKLCEKPDCAFARVAALYEACDQPLFAADPMEASPASRPDIPEPDFSLLIKALGVNGRRHDSSR